MATEAELLKAMNDNAVGTGASTQQTAGATGATGGATATNPLVPNGGAADTGINPPAATQQPAVDTGADGGAATAPTAPDYNNNVLNGGYNTARTDAIKQMYDAQRAQREAELKNAYEQSMSGYQETYDKISPAYQQKANDLAVQYERQRHNFFNEAAASGINTGTSAQESLARGGEYQRDFGALRTSEAEQQAAVERQMADRKAQYQSDVAAALAQNDYQKAGALLDEYNNGYQRDLDNAKLLASYGDFSLFQNLYGKDQADNMFLLWAAQNPDIAHNTGAITDDQFANLKAGKQMNDGLDENGKRIFVASSGGSGGGNTYFGLDRGSLGWDPGNHTQTSKDLQQHIADANAAGGHFLGR